MSFSRYSHYKKSGMEWPREVPEHWSVEALKYNSYVKGRVGWQNLRSEEFTDEGPYLITGMHFKDGSVDWSQCYHISKTRYEMAPEIQVKVDDVLITKDGSIGKLAHLRELPGQASLNSHLLVIRPLRERYLPRYLYLLLSSVAFRTHIDLHQSGTTFFGITQESVVKFPVILPPISEQRAIAAFLDQETAKIDALVAAQERLIELLKEKRQAEISHAVTRGLNRKTPMKSSSVHWLGDVPSHWAVVGLTKYLESVVDYRGRTPTKVDDGIFLVTARNIRDGAIDYSASEEYIDPSEYQDVMRRGSLQIGDVLFTTEAPLGQVANVDRTDVALAQRVIKLRGQSGILNNYFLKYWMMGSFSQADMVRLATGSTALGIKGSKVVQLRLCLPPYDEQVAIVSHLNSSLASFDALMAEAHRAIDLLQERRTILIDAAVTGKIDVRDLTETEVA